MNHLTELQCSMYSDQALPEPESSGIADHLAGCSECAARVARLTSESQALRFALALDEAPVTVPASLPDFTRPISLRQFAIANLFTGLLVWLGQFLWKTLFGDLVINAISWFTLIPIPDLFELTVSAVTYFSAEGSTMIDTYISLIGFFVIAASLTWLAFSFRNRLRGVQLCAVALLGAVLLYPASSDALEIRRGETLLTVSAEETIDDSLLIFGDTITIDGKVTGNVIALGERVIISGDIGGNLITAAESVSISGSVSGSALAGGSSVEITDARIIGDLLSAASDITLSDKTDIAGNAALASERLTVGGKISRDLWAFGNNIELSGAIGEDMEVFAARLNLLGGATVAGNLRLRTDAEDNLQLASSAKVGGEVEFLAPERKAPENQYLTSRFYGGQVLYLAGQFIVGLALFMLLPGLRTVSLQPGLEGLKTAGIGLVALVSLPIIALLAAVTLIGLPIGIISFVGWIVTIYLAKILLAAVIGRAVLSGTGKQQSLPLTLLAGLTIVLIAVNLPLIGEIISFLLTIAGFGLLLQSLMSYLSALEQDGAASV